MKLLQRIAFLLMCATVTIGATDPETIAQIVVKKHFASDVCAGFCVDETVTVFADGHVLWLTEGPFFRKSQQPTLRRFLVKPEAATAFIHAMSEVEPVQSWSDQNGCHAEFHAPYIWDWDITWKGSEHPVRLKSCDGNGRVSSAMRLGLKALGMPWGLAGELEESVIELPAE
jgi:hypothetical protein